jgi:hypothetical protein
MRNPKLPLLGQALYMPNKYTMCQPNGAARYASFFQRSAQPQRQFCVPRNPATERPFVRCASQPVVVAASDNKQIARSAARVGLDAHQS